MGQTADQLRQEVEHKREDAAQKIGQIEMQVEDTARRVQDTAERVKGSFDLQRQVQERPLTALGAALVGGLVLGGVLGGEEKGGQPSQHTGGQHGGAARRGGVAGSLKEAAKRSGLEDTVASITAAAMGLATDKLRATVDRSFPGFSEKMQVALQAGSSGGQTVASGRTASYRSPGAASGPTAHG